MAAIRSIGVHTPSGLAHLIAESILPEDPPETSYTWETYNEAHGQEELLVTDTCVVWSRGGVVKKVFSFDAEKQKVHQAILTWFPSDEDSVSRHLDPGEADDSDITQDTSRKRQRVTPSFTQTTFKSSPHGQARALVVFLKHQAHVYFLSGATHVLNLHFEVERAFPAPRGLILQRKLPTEQHVLSTPVLPAVPPNSFFSTFSAHQSQSKVPLRGSMKPVLPGELNFDLLKRSTTPAADTLPRHFSLINPLSEMGLVVHSPPEPRLNIRNSYSPAARDLESLDKDEEILYVSASDEIPHDGSQRDAPLTLVVTASKQRRMYSVWQAMYTDSRPASSLFTGRITPASGTKTRRRSSFVTVTGATTPNLRGRDNLRESTGGPIRAKTGPNLGASQSTQASAEDLMASQLDPEFDVRKPAKESRRVSSLLSRADLSTNFDRSAFEDLATHRTTRNSLGASARRGQSLGGPADRTSMGAGSLRKLRASTPGAFSRLSIDESSDAGTVVNHGVNGSATFDDLDEFDDIFSSHAGLDAIDFQQPFTGLKNEVLLSKFAEVSMNAPPASGRYSFGPESNVSRRMHFEINRKAKNIISIQTPEFSLSARQKWPQNQLTLVAAFSYTS
jgi:anaphase-promoting complex subunit 1